MDLTVLTLAVPRLSAELRPSSAQLLWIIDVYGFFVAGSLITMGTLGDRIGRRRLLLIGAAAFGSASVFAAFSTSATMLIVTRALLGIAGATLAPSTLSLIRSMFSDPNQRRLAIGVWVASFSVGGAVGPLVGGLVLQHFWWGAVFLIGVPAMVLLLLLGPLLLPEFRNARAGSLDVLSAALSMAAVLSLVYGMKRIAEHGFDGPAALVMLGGLGIGFVFVRRQQELPHPLIDLGLFSQPAFTASLALYLMASFVGLGAYIYVTQHLQLVLGLSPIQAGLVTVPSMLAWIVGSLVVPPIARRVHASTVMSAGLLLASTGFIVLAQAAGGLGVRLLIAGMVIYSLGISPVVILATDLVVGSAPVDRAGAASAISEVSSELGGALGIAILGSIGIAVYRSVVARSIPAGLPVHAAEAARATLGGALVVAGRLPEQLRLELLHAARAAFVHAFRVAAVVSAAITLLMAPVARLLLRGPARGPGAAPGSTA